MRIYGHRVRRRSIVGVRTTAITIAANGGSTVIAIKKYLSVEEIEAQIVAFLETIRLPNPFHRWVMRRLERTIQQKENDHATQKDSLLRVEAATARELQNLTKLRIRELLSDDEYLKERKELERQLLGVKQKLDVLAKRDVRFAPSQDIVLFNNCLADRFHKGTLQRKRMILATVGSHLVLTDKKLNIDAKKPFRRWTESANVSDLRAFVRDIRTHCDEDSAACQEMLRNIRIMHG